MAMNTDYQYMLDSVPCSSKSIIDAAAKIDQWFANDWLKQTSKAADILRAYGHTVEENPDFQ